LYGFINKGRYKNSSYQKLLSYLYTKPFIYTIVTDENRAEDGIGLRYRFGDEKDINDEVIEKYISNRECSVLEMLVALSIRCEKHIMDEPGQEDNTGKWFWGMIENLGLNAMDDNNSDYAKINRVLDIWMNRKYFPNGKGGLFTVSNRKPDLRKVEIWYQMCWHLDEILERVDKNE
jgi:hypothetical protein